jgi:hypothetical protein
LIRPGTFARSFHVQRCAPSALKACMRVLSLSITRSCGGEGGGGHMVRMGEYEDGEGGVTRARRGG